MESSAMFRPFSIKCINDDGDATGQLYECNKLNVWLNVQADAMLYTGQLLLIKDDSKNATRTPPSQRFQQRAQTHSSPKENQNTVDCSNIFSALKDADIEFNSSSTTTTCATTVTTTTTAAKGTSTSTTDSSAANSASIKNTASKTQSTTTSPSFTLTTTSPTSSKPFENLSFFRANRTGKSSTKKSPFLAATKPKPAVQRLGRSSGSINNASSFWNTGSQNKQDGPTPSTFFKAREYPEATIKKVSKDNVGASKFPLPSSLEDQSNATCDSEENDRRIDEKYEGDVDSSRGKRKRDGRKRESSNLLAKELLDAQLRCFQIQHSLYQIVVAKMRNRESKSELQAASQSSRDTESDDFQSLLLPLETLLRCSDIQLGLHHSLNVALDGKTERSQDDGKGSEYSNIEDVGRMIYDKEELLIESRSLMNQTKFAQLLVCLHLSNPYSSNLKYACGEDRIYSFAGLFQASNYYVPHGEGKLVSLDGNLIYEGQWKKGKRWGHGKAFIFSGNELSASKKQYGIYEGQWWNNMRHGHGRLVFASCDVYEGEWQYDLMSGVGAMHSPDGSVLEGLWDEDEPSGCGMFTWPNGAVEYREYKNGQVVKILESPGETKKISPFNEVMREYSILRLKYQMIEEDKTRLVQSESRLLAQQSRVGNIKRVNQAKVKELRGKFSELLRKEKKKALDKHQEDLKEMNERHDKQIKCLEDKISQIEAELDVKKSDLLCQICFERYRDCILMPCSHLLYCQICIAELNKGGKSARCPTCRGSIHSQINCNLNQSK